MSSPSGSSSHSGKRKRNNTSTTCHPTVVAMTANAEMETILQPSSRDASGEEGDTTAPESSKPHPSKRQRANSDRNNAPGPASTAASSTTLHQQDMAANSADPGEPSDTTEASVDIANRVGRKSRKDKDAMDVDMDGDNKKESSADAMPPPSMGHIVHPVGYRTNPPPVGRPVRVYADGVFDLFHLGHMRQLEQAKNAFPQVHLIVGVTGDHETHKRKGLTVLSGAERSETVRHCKWVDEVIDDCPWIVTKEFLAEKEIDYVAHDDIPYGADEGDDIYGPIKEAGKFLVTQRTEGVSTTGIITKIVRDYEQYIARQLHRGMSRQELNVSWLKKNEMDIKRQVQELRENIRTNWTTTGQELGREIKQFWPASRPQSPARFSTGSAAAVGVGPGGVNAGGDGMLKSPTSAAPGGVPGGVSAGGPAAERDLITGYTLGLIGGVRSWMENRRRTINRDSRAASDDDDDFSETSSSSGRRKERGSGESARKGASMAAAVGAGDGVGKEAGSDAVAVGAGTGDSAGVVVPQPKQDRDEERELEIVAPTPVKA